MNKPANQKGLSSLVLLFFIVLGIFIVWEFGQFAEHFASLSKTSGLECPSGIPGDCFDTDEGGGESGPICLTGEEGNCNDSNDVFILDESGS
jgi:hypothetical protein